MSVGQLARLLREGMEIVFSAGVVVTPKTVSVEPVAQLRMNEHMVRIKSTKELRCFFPLQHISFPMAILAADLNSLSPLFHGLLLLQHMSVGWGIDNVSGRFPSQTLEFSASAARKPRSFAAQLKVDKSGSRQNGM